MEFKKLNSINASKKFSNHFHYICLYYRHTHYGISQRQHVFRGYVIHSNCAKQHNFFYFMMDYDENGYLLFTLKNGSKNDWKLIIGVGEGVRGGLEKRCQMSWVEKNRKINNRGGDDYSGLKSS